MYVARVPRKLEPVGPAALHPVGMHYRVFCRYGNVAIPSPLVYVVRRLRAKRVRCLLERRSRNAQALWGKRGPAKAIL